MMKDTSSADKERRVNLMNEICNGTKLAELLLLDDNYEQAIKYLQAIKINITDLLNQLK